MPRRQRRRIRLDEGVYREAGRPVLVTVCTRGRRPVLLERGLGRVVESALRDASDAADVEVLAWCVMPDHVHMLGVPDSGGAGVVAWVRRFKGTVAARARARGVVGLWQRSFHDHVLRVDEAVRPAVEYVLLNPVRAGFVETWQRWPYAGSFVWDLRGCGEL